MEGRFDVQKRPPRPWPCTFTSKNLSPGSGWETRPSFRPATPVGVIFRRGATLPRAWEGISALVEACHARGRELREPFEPPTRAAGVFGRSGYQPHKNPGSMQIEQTERQAAGRARPPGAPPSFKPFLPARLTRRSSPTGLCFDLPVPHPYVIPIFSSRDQSTPYRVLQNVSGL